MNLGMFATLRQRKDERTIKLTEVALNALTVGKPPTWPLDAVGSR